MSSRISLLKWLFLGMTCTFHFSGVAQSKVSTADFDFYIHDTILLDPSQMELLSGMDKALQRTLTYKPKSDGMKTYHYISGKRSWEGNSVNKKREGDWLSWYDSGGMSSKIHYVNDRKEGSCTYWYRNGDLNAIGQYKNNLKDGEWMIYKEGRLASTCFYREGIIVNKVDY